MTTHKEERFQGSLMGVRIGDALGMPFETMTPEMILEITGPQGVTTFWDPQQHRTDAPDWAKELGTLRPGDFTDDWQLTRAGARSLLKCAGLLLNDLAREYIQEMRERYLGWGGTTKRGVRELDQYIKSLAYEGRPHQVFARFPRDAKPGDGSGNGVAMRIAPFALMANRVFDPDGRAIPGGVPIFQKMIWDIGGLTHPDPRASIGAYAVSAFIARLATQTGEPVTREELLRWFTQILEEVIAMEITLGTQIQMPEGTEKFSARLARVQTLIQDGTSAHDVRIQLGTSSYTLESVPFSIATFMRHPTDFRAALKEAVEAGGDTDTNAAIVGSMVGANVGIDGIPNDWRRFREDFARAKELGTGLYRLSETVRLAACSTT